MNEVPVFSRDKSIGFGRKISLFLLSAIFLIVTLSDAHAARKRRNYRPASITKSSQYAALVINSNTGDVLYQKNAGQMRYPASLTKLMTLYLTFEALEKKKLKMNRRLPISKKASSQPKSKLYLRSGQKITVEDAVLSLVVKSANDSAVVLAEGIGGSEWRFAKLMTKKAKKLGMRNTTFMNASGLHNVKQRTTAYDMARLAIALRRDFPKYYHLFARKSFYYNGRIVAGHNRVLSRYQGADGLKTGYVNASGYNLMTTTSRPEGKLVGVVMGGPTSQSRDNHMIQILDYGYKKLKQKRNTVKKRAKEKKAQTKQLEPVFSVVDAMEDKKGGVFQVLENNTQQYQNKADLANSKAKNTQLTANAESVKTAAAKKAKTATLSASKNVKANASQKNAKVEAKKVATIKSKAPTQQPSQKTASKPKTTVQPKTIVANKSVAMPATSKAKAAPKKAPAKVAAKPKIKQAATVKTTAKTKVPTKAKVQVAKRNVKPTQQAKKSPVKAVAKASKKNAQSAKKTAVKKVVSQKVATKTNKASSNKKVAAHKPQPRKVANTASVKAAKKKVKGA